MMELLWVLPLVFSISVVLGACRAVTAPEILRESGRTFVKVVLAMIAVILAFQLCLQAILRIF